MVTELKAITPKQRIVSRSAVTKLVLLWGMDPHTRDRDCGIANRIQVARRYFGDQAPLSHEYALAWIVHVDNPNIVGKPSKSVAGYMKERQLRWDDDAGTSDW